MTQVQVDQVDDRWFTETYEDLTGWKIIPSSQPVLEALNAVSRPMASGYKVYNGSDFAHLKFDDGYPGAFCEKVAAALAAKLTVPVAPCLLIGGERRGCLSRAMSPFGFTDCARHLKNEPGYRNALGKLYPLELYAFDVWIGNIDREAKNVCINDWKQTPLCLYGVDHERAFGFKRTTESSWRSDAPNIRPVQLPDFVERSQVEQGLWEMSGFGMRLAKFAEHEIKSIVERIAEGYGPTLDARDVNGIMAALEARRHQVVRWVESGAARYEE